MMIRKAVSSDKEQACGLVYSSGPAAFEHIFNRRHGPSVIDFLSAEFAKTKTMFSHRHHYVYELDGEVVGTIGCFDAASHGGTFLANAKAVFSNYGLRGILKGLLFELRLMKAPRKHCLYLCHVAVDPAYQGKGIAAKMINFMRAKAEEKGATYLSLDVAEQNTNALRLYQQMGFKLVNRNKSYSAKLDNHLYMELSL
ncbi:Mycothiol acetyltransferase [Zhongshania aliphaticivorans]|uniref:Mycothiol acetyltransferase n=1 Tax=Zhongshania aliphaticivorans TaxID=1470434 RepID=A0A5S9NKB0_9GAMM|nr:GNAT family N-acetyltransferase [Zhongshania aliphaticivorans]CAA0091107.1 Mycothiol acetyltransferase [Zhongshania aliphaticivorans]CAA0098586.1 Mycothiol acetyltransferase [Zhongshania aliphaticivorans]